MTKQQSHTSILNAFLRQQSPQSRFSRLICGEVNGDRNAIHQIGAWFVAPPNHLLEKRQTPYSVSFLHGRSAVVLFADECFVTIKGVGWTWGGPRVLSSPKDVALTFGLFSLKDAERELRVSRWLVARNLPAAKVLGLVRLDSIPTGTGELALRGAKSPDGDLINPTLLFTQTLSPVRVADLPVISPEARSATLDHACWRMGWSRENFVKQFTQQLGRNIGLMHDSKCINDTLEAGNITVCAEFIDFEWFTTPDEPLPDGTLFENAEGRRDKEIIYGLEIAIHLATVVNCRFDFHSIREWLQAGFQDVVAQPRSIFDSLNTDFRCHGTPSNM